MTQQDQLAKTLAGMSRDELRSLQVQVATRLADCHAKAREDAVSLVREIAAEAGMSIEELLRLAMSKGVKPPRQTKGIIYRHPTSGEEWTGQGRRPKWVLEWIEAGHNLEDLALSSAQS